MKPKRRVWAKLKRSKLYYTRREKWTTAWISAEVKRKNLAQPE